VDAGARLARGLPRTRAPSVGEAEMILTREAVISECLKFHGWGERFARTDGLEQEESRRALREKLLAEGGVRAELRAAVLRAEVTPGMRKSEVTAAWGLTHEDARDVYGHVVAVGATTYAYFTGFEVGRRHALCLAGETVVGVKPCDEILIRRDRELEMELARRYHAYVQFFETAAGELGGRTIDFNNPEEFDVELWLHGAYAERTFPPYSTDATAIEPIEWELRAKGRFEEYASALARLGASPATATPAERCRAAIEVAGLHAEALEEDSAELEGS
jgi:hypothetical protein